MATVHKPGPWRIVKVLNKARETRLAVARDIGPRREYVLSASGKVSTFCTQAGARHALRSAMAREVQAANLDAIRAQVATLKAAEAAGDSAALAGLWLDLHGLQCVDMEEAAADDRTPPAEAAAIIRTMLAEMIEHEGGDPAAILH